jgi:DNA topoisomerase-1
MDDTIRLFAGDCTVSYQGNAKTVQRGTVLTLVKPDNTVLVHDANGYQPAAWLTRADSVQLSGDGTVFTLTAHSGDTELSVRSHQGEARTSVPTSPAGTEVGRCPDCGRVLVRSAGAIICTGCLSRWGLPRDATLTGETCSVCGLPEIAVERGAEFQVCIDQACDPLDRLVADRFDGAWACPDCSLPMTIERAGSLQAVCPECGTGHTIPAGSTAGTCTCGLPSFETPRGNRCLDPGCGGQAVESRGERAP